MEANGKANGNGHDLAEFAGIEASALPGSTQSSIFPNGSKGVQQQDRLPAIIAMLLKELGLEIQSEHFRDTPKRVAALLSGVHPGIRASPRRF